MGQNLKNRLLRIRDVKSTGESKTIPERKLADRESPPYKGASWPGWTEAGFKTLKRVVSRELSMPIPVVFPEALAILIPDIFRLGRSPSPGELLFFDLETTGLSGGAGTVAFLAAFGRFSGVKSGVFSGLEITQYLLLDYPGEPDFIEMAVKEFSGFPPSLVVSFNGKSFDSQILKTRCLMNGISPPDFFHIDLLHCARRLWKRLLPDCSQATIEVSVLGLDRAGDVSGALAPEIWFSFLKTGENPGSNGFRDLLSVCDHNNRDILGLASLFLGLGEIAAEPFESRNKYCFDEEALALSWHRSLTKGHLFWRGEDTYRSCAKTGELLLKSAAENGRPRAAFTLAGECFKKGRDGEGRALLLKIAKDTSGDTSVSAGIRAAAFKSLAIDSEWRLKDIGMALDYTNSALEIPELSKSFRTELEQRLTRLEVKKSRLANHNKLTGSTSVSR